MDVEEGLKLAEQLLKRTLKPLEVLIFEESWKGREGKKYKEIAETYPCTIGNVNDAASDLWKSLSQVLGQKVIKSDFRRELEKISRSHSAIVPQPQEPAREETISKNPDFVGREEAIAESLYENDLDELIKKARLFQISPSSIKQAYKAMQNIPSMIQEMEKRNIERLELREKEKKGMPDWTGKEKLKSLEKELTLQEQKSLLSNDTQISIQIIEDFFAILPLDKQQFIKICSTLKLDWEKLIDKDFLRVLALEVPLIRALRHNKILELCGKLQLLYISRPIKLDELYVYVNILDEPPSYKWLEVSDLPQVYNPQTHEFDRLSLGQVSQSAIPGLLAVEKYHKLMVLGKPGAGKSTFLKYLTLQNNQCILEVDRVSIFIGLKTFTDDATQIGEFDLLKYIFKEFIHCGIKESLRLENILRYGRAIILLDGLDEVTKEQEDKTLECINTFCKQYPKNKFVITCRIAARKYRFSDFKDIEIADFNLEQIKMFAQNWFLAVLNSSEKDRIINANKFIDQLNYPENQSLQAIAVTPILLTLTCLAFQNKLQFPSNRTLLYKKGIEALLKSWDESRGVKRDDAYRKLSIEQKIELLIKIAANTFGNSRYFFGKDEIQYEIAEFLCTLNEPSSNSATLQEDSRAVLESIEAQHGLLVERAQEVYSFSHLTFQEYFTARKVKKTVDIFDINIRELLTNITDKRWHEVFTLVTDMHWNAPQLKFLKENIDEIIISDKSRELQDFLLCINCKSNPLKVPYKKITVRAFYFVLAYDLTFNASLTNITDWTYIDSIDNEFAQDINPSSNLTDAHIFSNTLDFAIDLNLVHKIKIALAKAPIDSLSLSRNCDHNPKLKQLLMQLGSQLPQLPTNDEDEECDLTDYDETTDYEQWWKINGQAWTEQLRKVIIEHRNIGHDWQFSDSHTEELLKQYYYGNKLLINCLNSASKAKTITPKTRSHIEDTLLLPIAEIEKLTPQD
ncbi:MAG: NACHT domain-containing NTPase [Coleofasciculaceae cyanobacterium]